MTIEERNKICNELLYKGSTDVDYFDAGYDYAIKKAYEWLYEHCIGTSAYQLTIGGQIIPYNEFVEQFKQTMEE